VIVVVVTPTVVVGAGEFERLTSFGVVVVGVVGAIRPTTVVVGAIVARDA
jgi:hypothetical protein